MLFELLGKELSVIKKSALYRKYRPWIEEISGDRIYLDNPKHGLCLNIKHKEKTVDAVTIYTKDMGDDYFQYMGGLPFGLQKGCSRLDVEKTFGFPCRSETNVSIPILRKEITYDVFKFTDYHLVIDYDKNEIIERIQILTPDAI